VHLHQREDETIFIRMGSGIATLGDREIPVTAGAIIYVPQGRSTASCTALRDPTRGRPNPVFGACLSRDSTSA
jgi:hypothetical protein